MNESLNFETETPQSGRRLPIEGKPFALVMEEMWNEGGWTGRIVR